MTQLHNTRLFLSLVFAVTALASSTDVRQVHNADLLFLTEQKIHVAGDDMSSAIINATGYDEPCGIKVGNRQTLYQI